MYKTASVRLKYPSWPCTFYRYSLARPIISIAEATMRPLPLVGPALFTGFSSPSAPLLSLEAVFDLLLIIFPLTSNWYCSSSLLSPTTAAFCSIASARRAEFPPIALALSVGCPPIAFEIRLAGSLSPPIALENRVAAPPMGFVCSGCAFRSGSSGPAIGCYGSGGTAWVELKSVLASVGLVKTIKLFYFNQKRTFSKTTILWRKFLL